MPLTEVFSIDKACIDSLSQLKFYVMLLKQVSPGYFAILYMEFAFSSVVCSLSDNMYNNAYKLFWY